MRVLAISLIFASALSGCLPAPSETGLADQNRVVDVVNAADIGLHFYATNASRGRAFAARFAEQDIRGNYYQTINFDDGSNGCLFDLFATFADGSQTEARKFNVCTEVSWVVSNGEAL